MQTAFMKVMTLTLLLTGAALLTTAAELSGEH